MATKDRKPGKEALKGAVNAFQKWGNKINSKERASGTQVLIPDNIRPESGNPTSPTAYTPQNFGDRTQFTNHTPSAFRTPLTPHPPAQAWSPQIEQTQSDSRPTSADYVQSNSQTSPGRFSTAPNVSLTIRSRDSAEQSLPYPDLGACLDVEVNGEGHVEGGRAVENTEADYKERRQTNGIVPTEEKSYHQRVVGRAPNGMSATQSEVDRPFNSVYKFTDDGFSDHHEELLKSVRAVLPKLWSSDPYSGQRILIRHVARDSYWALAEIYKSMSGKYDQVRDELRIQRTATSDVQHKMEDLQRMHDAKTHSLQEEKNRLRGEHATQVESIKLDHRRQIANREEALTKHSERLLREADESHQNHIAVLRSEHDVDRDKRLQAARDHLNREWNKLHRDKLREKDAELEQSLKERNMEVVRHWEGVNEKLHFDIQRLTEKNQNLTNTYLQDLEDRDIKYAQLEGTIEAKIQQQRQSARDELHQRMQEHEVEMTSLKSFHESEQRRMRKEHEQEEQESHMQLEKAEAAFQAAKLKLKQQHEDEKKQRSSEHLIQVNKMSDDIASHQKKVLTVTTNSKAERTELQKKHEAVIVLLKNEHRAMIDRLRREHKDAQESLTDNYNKQQKQMMRQLHESSEAVLARDDERYMSAVFSTTHLPRTADEHIKNQFSGVVELVEKLSRVESWKENRTIWNDNALAKFSQQNPRELRKNIIQDFIWTTLLEHVYCSPFRLFGDEGIGLEEEWIKRCQLPDDQLDPTLSNGKYTWPTPSVKAERWRYLTVHGCREALKEHPSVYDTRVHLKNDFNKNLVDTTKKLDSFLKSISNTSSETMRDIKLLLKAVSNMWLEFGMNRCRIMIFFKDVSKPKTVEEQMIQAQKGSLQLVIVPGIMRYGNERGEDLTNSASIAGCEGTTVMVSSNG